MSYPTAHTTQIENPRLRMLNKLRQNEYPLMTFVAIPSVRQAQIVALTGLDGIILDCEHGHIGDDSMHNSVAAIAALGVSPVIRIRGPAHDIIKRALDTGAHGIMVPQINNAEEARQIVQSSKFPPQGVRGQGSAFPAIGHGLTTPEYMKSANETILTMIQIETRAGVENVEEICAVDGVDMVFIGPNDLAQSLLGYVPARGDEPEFNAAVDKIIAAGRKYGKWVGRMVNNGTVAKEQRSRYDTVAITGDTKAIQNCGGIGSAIARALAAEGCDVALHCNSSLNKVEVLSAELQSCYANQLFPTVAADLSDREQTRALYDRIFQNPSVQSKHKAISILVANAGLGKRIRDINDIQEEDWDELMEVNARSQFVVTKSCLPAMRSQNWGRVILIGSIASKGGGINGCHYAATKGVLSAMGLNLSTVLAGEGITVNIILPAMIGATDMIPSPKSREWDDDTNLERLKETDPGLAIAASVPVHRLGHPEEVANVAIMMVKTGYLTGQEIVLSGGLK
ncbi:2-keto-3-deoxy-L-rhamnonate aldolase [Paramyrothecium foliicola]|nr:2-keto-3-deoxy-L-rhamnonate aldolase [Paramyrothecium foliicola]